MKIKVPFTYLSDVYFQKAENSVLKEVQEEIQASGELLMLTKLAYIKHIGGESKMISGQ